MRYVAVWCVALTWAGVMSGTAPALAQVRGSVGVEGALLSVREGSAERRGSGFGIGVAARAELRRWRFAARLLRAGVDPEPAAQPTWTRTAADLRLGYQVTPLVELEAGAARSYVRPAFTAQEIGLVRVGGTVQAMLRDRTRSWARIALLPVARFSGGGDPGIGIELGFGATLDSPRRGWRLDIGFEFERVDRQVNGEDAPVQTYVARAGVSRALRTR